MNEVMKYWDGLMESINKPSKPHRSARASFTMTYQWCRECLKTNPAYLCKNAVTGGRQVAIEARLIVVETWLLAVACGSCVGVK